MGGFVQRVEDVGKPWVRWEGQDQEPMSNKTKKQKWYEENVRKYQGKKDKKGDKGKNTRGGRGGDGRGNSAPPRGGFGRGQQHPPGQGPHGAYGQQPFFGQGFGGGFGYGQQPFGHAQHYYDLRDFADTDEFYRETGNEWNPEATAFEMPPAWCKPGGGFGPSRRQDDPDQDDYMGGGIGAPERVV
jgi:hypothetical protein